MHDGLHTITREARGTEQRRRAVTDLFRAASLVVIGLLAASRVVHAQTPLEVLAAFGSTGPQNPQAPLIQGADGNFYGTTLQGGTSNAGTIFQVTPAGAVTVLYEFTGGADGGSPSAGVTQGTDGNLYGTTPQGGAANAGTIFQWTPAGTFSVLYSFTGGSDGAYPYAGLIQGIDGNFYGTTSQGGVANAGTVFQLTPASTLAVLYAFTGGNDGAYPYAGLVQGADGNFYGTTLQGGTSNAGTIFQMTPAGALTVSYAFTGGADGGYPSANVIQGSDGNFYGTTFEGGTANAGTVFQLTPAGALSVLYTFTGGTDGAYPYAGIVQAADGTFYGTTLMGGASNAGTIFQVTSSGTFTAVYGFTGESDGAYPYAGLIQGTNGNLYGTAAAGGALGGGIVFRFGHTQSPTITWNTPDPIGYGTALSGAQLNATANVPGTFLYAPPAGTVLHAGPQTLTATFTPADTTTYATATRTVTLTVLPLTPAITWNAPADIPYGTPLGSTQLNARAKVPGIFTYSPGAGEVLDVGTETLSVTFTPTNSNYATATLTVTLTVTVATPVITWTPAAMPFGAALSGMQLNAMANASGTFIYSPPAGTVLDAGAQTLSVTFVPTDTTDYTTATSTAMVNVAIPGASGGGNEYPLQFTPAAGARGLVVAGYQLIADPVVGFTVVGNCSYYTVHSGSGRGGGYKTITTYFNQTCTWGPYGNLLTVTPGPPAVPSPISVIGTQTVYASSETGAYTGRDTALPSGGFVFTPGSHYSWLTPNPYTVLQQTLYTVTVTLESDGDMPLGISSVQARAQNGTATISGTTCSGQVPVGSTCAVTVTYDPTQLRSATGLAYDTLDISVSSDAGQAHDFAQSYTIVLLPKNTHNSD